MLNLEGLAIRQGNFVLEADLTVAPGRIVALLGPSGAGKSTLLDSIAGFLAPDRGRVLWQGSDLGPLAPGDRPLSVLFQDNNLFPHLTAARNVGLGLRPDLRLTPAQGRAVEAALDRVGLGGLGERKPAALSGGQRGRVALARMLLRNRPLMLLDEPFAALGPALKAEMLALVAELARETGATVLFVTHDPADARAIADETVLVAEGRAHPPRPTERLLADPPPALRAYLG
ncbi:sulfate/thiosulfate import ATP-binding protein CysA [Rhodovulum sulfidophilum]|uniref:Sulfate/thiosulfate import ATP-binding protein CysA n=1 Tax=Rhodovulum sulfidophilum TaxID=35806 RepID=A0A0D6B9B5_RHOSU|nr:sulfate/thiosulfate import ATP-binding protein CysA [Rhodovulum sulfidophilum]